MCVCVCVCVCVREREKERTQRCPKQPLKSQTHKIEGFRYQSPEQLRPVGRSQTIVCVKSPNSAAIFASQAKAKQRRGRLVEFEQTLQNKQQHTVTDDKKYQLQSSEANYTHLNAGFGLKSSSVPPVNTVPQVGQIESL